MRREDVFSARSVHLHKDAGEQALARTCNLDYSEGLPINRVDRKAFFFAPAFRRGSSLGLSVVRFDLPRDASRRLGCHSRAAGLLSLGLEFGNSWKLRFRLKMNRSLE
jgi:hypothetical protein